MPKYYTNLKLSENIAETPEGFLLCVGVPITRTGSFIYGEGETPLDTVDGEVSVSRSKEDIFNEQCIASFEGKPVTINHPTDFVTPHTWKDLARGHMQNVRPGKEDERVDVDGKLEDVLLADLLIKEFIAIQLVKNGLREVSNGYEAEYEQTGEGMGRQFNIRGNHIALVDKGRAGPVCAINDKKWEGNIMSKFKDLVTKLNKVFDAEMAEKKDDKAKDEEKPEPKKDEGKSEDAAAYDELKTMMKDMMEKVEKMGGSKDEEKKDEPKKDDEKKDDAKDDESGAESSLEDRMKALETAVAKLLEKQTGDEEEEPSEESEDAKDDDFEESSMTGDVLSRAEILAPGIKKQKDIKAAALKAAYATKEGKKVIDALSGGKPTFDSAEKVNMYFTAASEILKAERGTGLEKTKNSRAFDTDTNGSTIVTAEKMNEINERRWANK